MSLYLGGQAIESHSDHCELCSLWFPIIIEGYVLKSRFNAKT